MDKTRNQMSLPWPGWTPGNTVGRSEPVGCAKPSDELW